MSYNYEAYKKYNSKFNIITIRVPKIESKIFKKICRSNDISMNKFLLTYIRKTNKQNKNFY